MKKVLAYVLSLSMITSSLALFAQADSVIGNIDMDTEIVEPISQAYPFDFELISVEDDYAAVSMESKMEDYTFYLGIKGEKEEISAYKSTVYHLEVEQEYSFVYTYSTGNELKVYNGTLILVDYGDAGVYVKTNDVVLNTTYDGSIDISTRSSSAYVTLSAGDKDEVESNDTYGLADRTYDDYDNYGTIDTESDVDWWKIEFDEDGEANFWLGNIPDGCDFDLYLYDEYGVDDDYLARSQNGDNEQELITYEVEAGVVYYVEIYSYSGASDDYYLFRAKNYPYETIEDEYESNNDFGDPTYIDKSSNIYATIHDISDEDYYRVYFNSSYDLYNFEITLRNVPSGCDYELELYDSMYDRIAYSYNGSGSNEYITKKVEPGTYYIKVFSQSGYSDSQYRLVTDYTSVISEYNGFELNRTVALIPEGSLAEIELAEEEYNAMPLSYYTTAEQEDILQVHSYAMAGVYLTEDSLPDASDMLFYFLNQTRNTDGKYTSFSTLDMLEDNEAENQYSRLIEEVNEAMDAIEYLLLENELDNIAFCQIEQNTSDEFAGTQGTNWVFSVNNYRTWIEGVAVCDGDEFEATLYYNVEDYYNWDPALDYGESLGNFILNVAVSNLWQFNWCGLARNYFASGDVVEINISWSLGDRFNDNSLLDMSIY